MGGGLENEDGSEDGSESRYSGEDMSESRYSGEHSERSERSEHYEHYDNHGHSEHSERSEYFSSSSSCFEPSEYSEYEDEEFEDDEYDKGEADEGESEEELDFPSRTTSVPPAEDEATASAIMESVQSVLGQAGPSSAAGPVRMTDLGFKISQLVLDRRPALATEGEPEMEMVMEEEPDAFLEKTLSGRRRNRTGVRGRPKKVDYGFGRSTTHVLPPEVARLMGQANISYVSRRYDDAIALLLEVVRQAPHAFEAYQTLGMVHEEKGDLEKALSYFVIAAHLIKHDADLWRKLARLTLEIGNRPTEAIYYLSKLIRMRDVRPEYFWTRARLWVERGEYKKAVLGFQRLLVLDVEGDAQTFEQVATLAERLEHSDLLGTLFLQVISQAVEAQRCPSLAVVMYVLEWLMGQREFDKMQTLIEVVAVPLVSETGLSLSGPHQHHLHHWFAMDQAERVQAALTSLPVEVALYYAIVMVNLKGDDERSAYQHLQLNAHRHGRLMKVLGGALLANAQPRDALALLSPLLDVPELGDADLLVLVGECYRLMPGEEENAIRTFEVVLEISPERNDARTALCDLYRQRGDLDRAAEILRQTQGRWTDSIIAKTPQPREPLDVDSIFAGLFAWDMLGGLAEEAPQSRPPALLHIRQPALRKRKRARRPRRIRQYVSYSAAQMHAAQQAFQKIMGLAMDATSMRQCRQLSNPLVEDMLNNPSIRPSHKVRQVVRTSDLALLHGLTIQQWFSLLCKFLVVECHVGSLDRAFKLTRIFLSRSIFALDDRHSATLRLFHIGIATGMKDRPAVLLSAARLMLRAWPDQSVSLAVLMRAIWRGAPEMLDGPFVRFLERHSQRNAHGTLIHAAAVATFLYTERFEHAIRTGYALLAVAPDHPLGLLATAVALLHQSTKRTCRSPAQLQRRALALLHHYRGAVGEAGDYNVARAYHMLGLFDLASIYYRRALTGPFREEAAFNMHLMMVHNGEIGLAGRILEGV